MVTTKLNLFMTEPSARQIYAKQGDTGRVLDITLDQTPEDGTLRILRPDGVEVTSEAVTGGEVESSGTFESLTEADVTELTVGIEPVQDLNGYDKPWVGGAGKNLLRNNASSKTENGITFTVNADGTVSANGTASGAATIVLTSGTGIFDFDNDTILSGSVGGFGNNVRIRFGLTNPAVNYDDFGNGVTIPRIADISTRYTYVQITIASGTTVNNLTFRPMIRLASETDATYEPYSNICPITGHDEVRVTRTGINVWDEDWTNGSINTETGVAGAGNNVISRNYILVAPNTTYYVTPRIRVFFYDSSKAFLSFTDKENATFTTPSNCRYILITAFLAYGTTYNNDISINYPSTDHDYHAYQGSTYTTSLGQTVYGGTLDMVTGTLTLTHALGVLDGTGILYYIDSQSGSSYTTAYVQTTDFDSVIDKTASGISNMFEVRNASMWGTDVVALQIANSVSSVRLRIPKSLLATEDVDGVRAWLTANPVQIYYKLATPVTYTLTAQQIKTLVGINNVWASSGDIVNITFTYGGLLSELPSDATSVVGKCYCDVEQNGVSSMPFTLNVKKNERES